MFVPRGEDGQAVGPNVAPGRRTGFNCSGHGLVQ